jgi:hypothetical protein
MQRLAFVTSAAPTSTTAPTCDCCDHDGNDNSRPESPSPKPDCQCKIPAIVALQSDQSSAQFHPAIVVTAGVIEQTLLPAGVIVSGDTSVAYATGPTRSSPLRQ